MESGIWNRRDLEVDDEMADGSRGFGERRERRERRGNVVQREVNLSRRAEMQMQRCSSSVVWVEGGGGGGEWRVEQAVGKGKPSKTKE